MNITHKNRLTTQYGPWAVITGASSGIGEAFAEQLAEAGIDLVLVARRGKRLEQLGQRLQTEHGIRYKVIQADLAEAGTAEAIAHQTANLPVGLLIASAGFGTTGHFATSNLEQELNMLDLNCRALLILSRKFGARFAEQGRGGLILLSSILAFQGGPNSAHYAATKGYVQILAEGIAAELAPSGVDVLACAPGPTSSEFAARANMEMGPALTPRTVASETLNKLGRQTTVLPGFLSKLIVYSLSMLPRFMRTQIMGNVLKGMRSEANSKAGLSQV